MPTLKYGTGNGSLRGRPNMRQPCQAPRNGCLNRANWTQSRPTLPHNSQATVTPNTFPATEFMKDWIKMDMGHLTRDEMRRNFKAGKYAGVDPKWMAFQFKQGV